MKSFQSKGTATDSSCNSSKNLTVILPLFILMFVFAATNYEAKASWLEHRPNALHTFDGGSNGNVVVHVGRDIQCNTPSGQSRFAALAFGAGNAGGNWGLWTMSAEFGGFRIGKAKNMPIFYPGTIMDGHYAISICANGTVGINHNDPYAHLTNPIWNTSNTDVKLRTGGSTVARANFTYSDRRYKADVESINNVKNLFGLNSVQYRPSSEAYKEQLEIFKQHGKDLPKEMFNLTVSSLEKQIAEADADTSLHFGFIAQDLQKLFPNLVIEDQGFLAVNYVGLIPVLVDAIQEQQKTLEEQHKMLEAQQRQINQLLESRFEKSGTNSFLNDARLEQNSPNPFNSSTEIKFYVPENSTVAGIHIYDMTGKELLRLDAPRGNSSVTLDARQLNAGMYLYSLIIDGREIDTKRMILTNN